MDEHLLRFDKDKTYTLIDCETENLCLGECNNLPWQVGMIKAVGGERVAHKDLYVGWPRDLVVSKEAARITGFSQKKYKELSIPVEEIFPTVEDWLENCDYILGHNILGFDIFLIKHMYEHMGKKWTHLVPKVLDTNCIARGIKNSILYRPEEESFIEYQYKMLSKRTKGIKTNLKALGLENEIDHDYDNLHDAIVDLELNLKVWNKLKWQVEI